MRARTPLPGRLVPASRGGLAEIETAAQAASVQAGIDRTVLLAFAASESSLRASRAAESVFEAHRE